MIEQPYLLVMTLPCFLDERGVRSVEELWHKDLVEHLAQIRDLRLASPLRFDRPPMKVLPIDHGAFEGGLTFVDLPPCNSTLKTLLSLPRLAATLWRAVGRAEIVHGAGGGWPFSFGALAIPMARLRGKFTLTVIESASWRLGFRRPLRLKTFLQGCVFEPCARMMVNISDLAFFTQSEYRDSMLRRSRMGRAHILPASWIDRDKILPAARAEAIWRDKLADPDRPLRVLFAANLLETKGLLVLAEALEELARRGVAASVDIYGQGPLRGACDDLARRLTGSVSVRVRGTIDYGPAFFEMLEGQDVMIAPNLSDEQPRIIFDCFARALPVIGSDTPGIRECLTDGVEGRTFPTGDARALAGAIERAARGRESLREFGINGLRVASSLTHDQMHARRAAIIEQALRAKVLSPA